jgi:hypothetical protein
MVSSGLKRMGQLSWKYLPPTTNWLINHTKSNLKPLFAKVLATRPVSNFFNKLTQSSAYRLYKSDPLYIRRALGEQRMT